MNNHLVCKECEKPKLSDTMDTRLYSFLENADQSRDIPSDFLITGSWALRHYLRMLGIHQELVPNDFDLIIRDSELRRKKGHVSGSLNSGVKTMVGTEHVDMISPEMIRKREDSLFLENGEYEYQRDHQQHMVDIVNLVKLYEYGLEDELNDLKREERSTFVALIKESDLYKQEAEKRMNNSKQLQTRKKPERVRTRKAIPFSLF